MEQDNERRNVMVVMTPELADESLRAANARGMSRSAWLRALIERELAAPKTGRARD